MKESVILEILAELKILINQYFNERLEMASDDPELRGKVIALTEAIEAIESKAGIKTP